MSGTSANKAALPAASTDVNATTRQSIGTSPAAGRPAASAEGTVRSAQNWGRACYVGEGNNVELNPSPDIIHRQLTLYGSWTFNPVGMAECARFVMDRKVPLSKLLTHRFKLEEAEAAYKLFDTQTTGKGVFLFD